MTEQPTRVVTAAQLSEGFYYSDGRVIGGIRHGDFRVLEYLPGGYFRVTWHIP